MYWRAGLRPSVELHLIQYRIAASRHLTCAMIQRRHYGGIWWQLGIVIAWWGISMLSVSTTSTYEISSWKWQNSSSSQTAGNAKVTDEHASPESLSTKVGVRFRRWPPWALWGIWVSRLSNQGQCPWSIRQPQSFSQQDPWPKEYGLASPSG